MHVGPCLIVSVPAFRSGMGVIHVDIRNKGIFSTPTMTLIKLSTLLPTVISSTFLLFPVYNIRRHDRLCSTSGFRKQSAIQGWEAESRARSDDLTEEFQKHHLIFGAFRSSLRYRFGCAIFILSICLVSNVFAVIIMGYPASGIEGRAGPGCCEPMLTVIVPGLYRNRREDAQKFLRQRHGTNFWVYNFCPIRENSYPSSVFDGRVSRYPFPDHQCVYCEQSVCIDLQR